MVLGSNTSNQEPIIDEDGDQLYQRGTTNVWSIISTDPELNLIYLPTGNTADNYGGHRNGSDYYSSSVVALNASTGEVVLAFFKPFIMIFGTMMFLLSLLFMMSK